METARLVFDASELAAQVKRFAELIKSSILEGLPHGLVSECSRLIPDVILTDSSATVGADGTKEALVRLHFGDGFESLRSAMLAG